MFFSLFGYFLERKNQENALTCARDSVPLRNDFRAKKWSGTRTQRVPALCRELQPEQEFGRDEMVLLVASHALQVDRFTVRLHSGGERNGRR